MPIVNLTKTSEVGSGLPRIGKLHKGGKKTEANRPGPDLDYFRMEFEPEFADLKEDWEALYGENPDGFDLVYMTHATVDDAFATWKEEWNSSATMLHRCDGEHQVTWYSQQAQAYSHAKEKCAMISPTPCACKNVGRLNLLIPEFIQVTGILGYVMVETHSINDILTVYRTLADVQRINGGTLLGVPFSLGRATKKISAPNAKTKTRINVNKSLFYLHVDPDFTRETLLPRLAQSGGFLSAQQPQLAAPVLPQLGVEEAKKLLGSGNGQRRMGTFELPPRPYDDEDENSEPTTITDAPLQTNTSPVATPQEKTDPPKQKSEQTVIGLKTVSNALGELKNRLLKEVFNGKFADMNNCLNTLLAAGKLPSEMSIDDAFEIIKLSYATHEAELAKLATDKPATPKAPPPVAAKGYTMTALKIAVLNTIYGDNAFHMNGSLSKLLTSGKLPPSLTLEQAIEVVKNRKDDEIAAPDSEEVVIKQGVNPFGKTDPVSQAMFDNMPRALELV